MIDFRVEGTYPENYDPYAQLAAAVVLQAIDDYRALGKKIKKANDDQKSIIKGKMKSISRFFLSDWFAVLSDLDGTNILVMLSKEVDEENGCA